MTDPCTCRMSERRDATSWRAKARPPHTAGDTHGTCAWTTRSCVLPSTTPCPKASARINRVALHKTPCMRGQQLQSCHNFGQHRLPTPRLDALETR
eukprot:358139-Chlamydomonas_euryale.AAC.4